MAELYPTTMAGAPIAELLDIGGFNLDRAMEMKPEFLEPEYPFEWGGIWTLPSGQYYFALENGPDPDMAILLSDASEASELAVLNLAERVFVEFSKTGEPISDKETITEIGKCYRLQLQNRESYEFTFNVESNKNVAVFSQHTPVEFNMMLRDHNGNEHFPDAEHFFNAGHEHDDTVTSVAIKLPGLFDLTKLNGWLNMFLQVNGVDIYRMKGVVGVAGESHQIVFQGVHMMFDSQLGKPWGDEEPVNKLVFIGKDLSESFIYRSLESCLDGGD